MLVDGDGQISGIIDFGDASWSALVVDLAAVLETVVDGREEDSRRVLPRLPARARWLRDGSRRSSRMSERISASSSRRACARASSFLHRARRSMKATRSSCRTSAHRRARSCACSRRWAGTRSAGRLGVSEPGSGLSVPALVERRKRVIGPAMTPPTYREPLHFVRGDGVWLIDADGRRFLDAYNNVPVVGHEHPRVVEAIARQARRLNTNMRYLHETALEVAERLSPRRAARSTRSCSSTRGPRRTTSRGVSRVP